jgi:hypothetical protein
MFKKIRFTPAKEEWAGIFDAPVPIKTMLPEWYKRQNKYTFGEKSYSDYGLPNHTIKGCMPVFDLLTSGYLITLPADVKFQLQENGLMSTAWSTNAIKMIESHPVEQYNEFKIDDSFYPLGFKFINPWVVKTPPGYSCLFMTPSYNDELPFYILPAIVDTDKHPISVNFPFFIKKDFEGIIPMGTPLVQIIPFKRDDWKSETIQEVDKSLWSLWSRAEGKMGNRYKTFFRQQRKWQ